MVSISNHVGSSNKLEKDSNEADRISSLPDSVLVHILSFLPTKYAVGTSILSSRWKNLWASVPTLDFDLNLRFEPRHDGSDSYSEPLHDEDVGDSNFINFVDRVLFNHDLSYIQKFSLSCVDYENRSYRNRSYGYRSYGEDSCEDSGINLTRIYTWISVAIKRGVEVLDINIASPKESLVLPLSLFTCPTLRVLKLGKQLRFDVPFSTNLENLRILHLSNYEVQHTHDMVEHKLSLKNIIHTCPVLEDLFLDGIYLDPRDKQIVYITTPSLKRLRLERINFYDGHKIVINAPSLEYLTLQDDCLGCFVLSNLTSLVKADFINVGYDWSRLTYDWPHEDCKAYRWEGEDEDSEDSEDEDREYEDPVLQLLCEIGSVKYLSLGASTMKAIRRRLLLFPYLMHLKLCVYDHSDWESLLDLLKGMPRLVNLVLKKLKGPMYEGSRDFDFVEPEEVPYCLSYLQTIKFSGFNGRENELTLMEYILRNAKALQQMKFVWRKSVENKEGDFQSKLLMFPRASTTCQILFSSKVSRYRY